MNKLRFFTKVAMQCQSQEHLNDANLFSLFRFHFLEKSIIEIIPLTILELISLKDDQVILEKKLKTLRILKIPSTDN